MAPMLAIEVIGAARRTHMRRHIAFVSIERPPQAFAVNQPSHRTRH